METTAFLPVIWVFLLAFAACATLFFAIDRGDRPMQRRLNDLAVKFRMGDGAAAGRRCPAGVTRSFVEWAQRRMPDPNLDKPAVEKLVADARSHAWPRGFRRAQSVPGHSVCWRPRAASCSGYLAGAIRGGTCSFLWRLARLLDHLLPLLSVGDLARSRQTKIRREIADVIDLLVVCVECGLGLMASIRIVGRESERQGRIMGAQLSRLSAELAAGSSLGEGLRAVADRTGVEDIRTFSAILVQSEKLGTEMAQALRATADQLRVKRGMRAEEMAQKLPIKMIIPLILFLLPAMMLILAGPPAITIIRNFKFG